MSGFLLIFIITILTENVKMLAKSCVIESLTQPGLLCIRAIPKLIVLHVEGTICFFHGCHRSQLSNPHMKSDVSLNFVGVADLSKKYLFSRPMPNSGIAFRKPLFH